MTKATGLGSSAAASGNGGVLDLIAHLTETINSSLDLKEVLQAVTDTGTELSGGSFGAFFYNAVTEHGDSYRLHVLSGVDADLFAHFPAPRITELFHPTYSGSGTIKIDDLHSDPRFRGLPAGHVPLRSYLATPVVTGDGDVVGALLFGHPEPDMFDDAAQAYVRAVAAQAAVAVSNARLFAAEQLARQRAEAANADLEQLQSVTSRLASAMTVTAAFDAVADAIVEPSGAARMGVYVQDGDRFQSVIDSPDAPPARRAYLNHVHVTEPTMIADVVKYGKPVWVESRAELESRYPYVAERAVDAGGVILLPLTVGDITRGALALSWRGSHRFTTSQIRLFASAAGQLAVTLERLRLFEAEEAARRQLRQRVVELTEASQTLQRALLPERLPPVPGLAIASRYLPAATGAEVGGDWYDVVVAPDHVVTLVVGDVQGHSLSAAATMGRVSSALRAFLSEGHGPDVALERAAPLVESTGVLVTVMLVSVDTATGLVRLARAGHPHPVFARPGQAPVVVPVDGGPPLGVGEGRWPVTLGWSQPGDQIVLYTDGLIEMTGTTDIDTQMELVASAAGHRDDVEAVADHILEATAAGRFADDVALLVAQFAGPVEESASRLRIDGTEKVSQARKFTTALLERWDLPVDADTCELLVSEMVTNALVHAGGPAKLEVRRMSEGVRIAVTDHRSEQPEPRDAGVEETGGRGMMLVEGLAHAWGVEPAGTGKTVWALVTT